MKTINGNALRKLAQKMDVLGGIYETVKQNMQWDCMTRTDDQDENGSYIYIAPEKEISLEEYSYNLTSYEKYMVYQEVLAAIEKLAK